MRIIFSFLLLMISCSAFSQDNYKKGYIIGNSGDTTSGYIKEDIEEKLSKAIDFKNPEGLTKTLTPEDIIGFGFDGKNQFRVVTYIDPLDGSKKKTHFAKLLIKGNYQIFSFRKNDDLYFVAANSDTSYLLYDDIRTNLGEISDAGNFYNLLSYITHDCPRVSNTAANTRFAEEAVISFFKSFDKCKGIDHPDVYYAKPTSDMSAFLSAGAFALKRRSEISAQVLVQFLLPSISVKTSLNTGFVYLRKSHETVEPYSFGEIRNKYTTEVFELPLLIRYDITKTQIRPYVFGGPGAMLKKEKDISTKTTLSEKTITSSQKSAFGPTFIFAMGVDIRVTKNLFVDLNWRYDLEIHLPVAGLAIKIK